MQKPARNFLHDKDFMPFQCCDLLFCHSPFMGLFVQQTLPTICLFVYVSLHRHLFGVVSCFPECVCARWPIMALYSQSHPKVLHTVNIGGDATSIKVNFHLLHVFFLFVVPFFCFCQMLVALFWYSSGGGGGKVKSVWDYCAIATTTIGITNFTCKDTLISKLFSQNMHM